MRSHMDGNITLIFEAAEVASIQYDLSPRSLNSRIALDTERV